MTRLEVFGSAARGDDFDPARSDADFLVEFGPTDMSPLHQFFGFRDALADLLGRRVDLVESRIRNPYIRAAAERDRTHVFAA